MQHLAAAPLQERVGHYDIFLNHRLGRGTYGDVHLGKDTRDGTGVAVKCIQPQRNVDISRYIAGELHALQSVSHPNVVQLLHHERLDANTFFVLELCDGDLASFAQNPVFESQKMQVIEDSTCAVSYLHSNNIIHRDIKPENILIKDCGGKWIAKVTDFGLSRRVPQDVRSVSLTGQLGMNSFDNVYMYKLCIHLFVWGIIIFLLEGYACCLLLSCFHFFYQGTFAYMAPEVYLVRGQARYSKPADVFSLALTNLSVAAHRPGEELDFLSGMRNNFSNIEP